MFKCISKEFTFRCEECPHVKIIPTKQFRLFIYNDLFSPGKVDNHVSDPTQRKRAYTELLKQWNVELAMKISPRPENITTKHGIKGTRGQSSETDVNAAILNVDRRIQQKKNAVQNEPSASGIQRKHPMDVTNRSLKQPSQ